MLPPYDSHATLADLTSLARRLDAGELWCLGDSFHDDEGCERLPGDARAALIALTSSLRFVWITGNHDAGLVDHCGGEILVEAEVGGLILRHEARRTEARPELSGHFHPKLRLTQRGRNVARRCFVRTTSKLILPAFGSLTGGLDAHHPEILRVVGPRAEAMVALTDRLLRFPLAA
jgi:hypothetical protein